MSRSNSNDGGVSPLLQATSGSTIFRQNAIGGATTAPNTTNPSSPMRESKMASTNAPSSPLREAKPAKGKGGGNSNAAPAAEQEVKEKRKSSRVPSSASTDTNAAR